MKKPNRFEESTASLYSERKEDASVLIIGSGDDTGVRLNLGRAGSRFAPLAIMNTLKKFSKKNEHKIYFEDIYVKDKNLEETQLKEAKKLESFLEMNKTFVHLGGGHDNIYPLLLALQNKYEEFTIINIDAHLDTRIDTIHHSGTPFRNFDEALETKEKAKIIQYGIHHYANTDSTRTELPKLEQHIISFEQIKTQTENFKRFAPELIGSFIEGERPILISLDADAVDTSIMSAVSATNPEGFPLSHIRELILFIKSFSKKSYFGIYELNPLYDDLSQKGTKAIASLVYDYINE